MPSIRSLPILLCAMLMCATMTATDADPATLLIPVKVTNTATFKDVVGYVDATGAIIIKPAFESAAGFSEGLAWAQQGGKYGFVDPAGKTVVPFKFDDVGSFKSGIARVKLDGKWGLIRPDGSYLKEPTFSHLGEFHEGLAAFKVEKDGKFGFMDVSGKLVIAPTFSGVGPFSEGLAAAAAKGVYGYVDTAGKLVIPMKYGNPTLFLGGLAVVQDETGTDLVWKVIDKSGMVVKEVDHRIQAGGARFTSFFDGVAYWVDANKVPGAIDTSGTKRPIVLMWNGKPWAPQVKRDITVEKVVLANDGILSISLFGKWTYADTKLNLLSDQPFDSAWTFGESVPGLGKVMIEGKICWIDKSGKLAWDGRKLTKWDPDAGKLLP